MARDHCRRAASFVVRERRVDELLAHRSSAWRSPCGPQSRGALASRRGARPTISDRRGDRTRIETVSYRMWLGRPVAEATTARGTRLFDARTGALLPAPTAAQAQAVARAAWRSNDHPSVNVELIDRASPEYRGTLPAWRVTFADPDSTRIFVAADTGRIAAVRTGTWRLYDFFWSLHIMDWKNHEDFNTPWLLGFALGGLGLWLGGAVLLCMRWPKRRRSSASG